MNFLTPFGWAGFVVLALILLLRELRPILERRNGKNGLALNGASLTAGQLPKEYWQLEMRESLVEGLKTTNELLARLVEVQEEMRDLHRNYIIELKLLKEEVIRNGRRMPGGNA